MEEREEEEIWEERKGGEKKLGREEREEEDIREGRKGGGRG